MATTRLLTVTGTLNFQIREVLTEVSMFRKNMFPYFGQEVANFREFAELPVDELGE